MKPINITKVQSHELNLLQKIALATFQETFATQNSVTAMEQYVKEKFDLSALNTELQNLQSEFYFAWVGTEIAGYLKVNYGTAQTEQHSPNALEIERIYVLKAFQGMKIGQKLMEKALSVAQSLSLASIWLGVWEHNTLAIQFYEKHDFEVFGKHDFNLGDDIQTDWMMRRIIC